MTTLSTCPHLGLSGDRTVAYTEPNRFHRCHAVQPPSGRPDEHQRDFCLTAAYHTCEFYPGSVASSISDEADEERRPAGRWLRFLPFVALALIVLVIAVVYARDVWRPPAPAPQPSPATATPTRTRAPAASPGRSPAPAAVGTRSATATPEPGGRSLTLTPKSGEAGWWVNGEPRGNHLGDSFLYAGYFGGQAFIAAVRFELAPVARGAPIREAVLVLTGLNAERFTPGSGGVWSVQLLPADALQDYARADFQALLNAPAAITLIPTLYPADLSSGGVNRLALDGAGRAWLERQVLDGAPVVIARITGPAGGGDTLFAWDSGAGVATVGEGPRLLLNIGPPPATPPPLPTELVLVATLTPTPANVLTAAARVWTATAAARALGAATPLPYRVVTPTATPANLATVQALALSRSLRPVVPHTPTPANGATATANALVATAVAATTGTFTPVPTDRVTPAILTPTPQPQNVLTAAARALLATAEATRSSTPTPTGTAWPYNAIVATPTASLVVIASTPTPANAATAEAYASYATAVAIVTGTFTPLPPNAATPTSVLAAVPAATGTSVAGLSSICPDARAQITAPQPRQSVRGAIRVTGVAVHQAFAYYKLELAAGEDPAGGYAEVGRGADPVSEDLLGTLDLTAVANGVYTLRLTVVDRTGNYPPPCRVIFSVQD